MESTAITAVNHTSTNAVFHADYSIDSVTTVHMIMEHTYVL